MNDPTSKRNSLVKRSIRKWNAFIPNPEIRRYKYALMKADAFSFFRGTNHLFYQDIHQGTLTIPQEWQATPHIRTWIQGDLHARNLGFFENTKGKIIFDLNDFDDALIAPFYWDILRFISGLYLMKDLVGFHPSSIEVDDLAWKFLVHYQKTLSITVRKNLNSNQTSGFIQSRIKELNRKGGQKSLLAKWTRETENHWEFDFSLSHLSKPSPKQILEISGGWKDYLRSTGRKELSSGDSHTLLDIAIRHRSGLGSLGLERVYLIVQKKGKTHREPILLEMKEQREPSLFSFSQISLHQAHQVYSSPGQRVYLAKRSLLKNGDNWVGYMNAGKSYSVQKLAPSNDGFQPGDFKNHKDLKNFIRWSAIAIAQAHGHSNPSIQDSSLSISPRLGIQKALKVWPNAKTTLIQMAKTYAQQVKRDWKAFKVEF